MGQRVDEVGSKLAQAQNEAAQTSSHTNNMLMMLLQAGGLELPPPAPAHVAWTYTSLMQQAADAPAPAVQAVQAQAPPQPLPLAAAPAPVAPPPMVMRTALLEPFIPVHAAIPTGTGGGSSESSNPIPAVDPAVALQAAANTPAGGEEMTM